MHPDLVSFNRKASKNTDQKSPGLFFTDLHLLVRTQVLQINCFHPFPSAEVALSIIHSSTLSKHPHFLGTIWYQAFNSQRLKAFGHNTKGISPCYFLKLLRRHTSSHVFMWKASVLPSFSVCLVSQAWQWVCAWILRMNKKFKNTKKKKSKLSECSFLLSLRKTIAAHSTTSKSAFQHNEIDIRYRGKNTQFLSKMHKIMIKL